jgi:hypothetical protein
MNAKPNANEVVRALRNCKAYKTKSDLQITMIRAADLIESLQAQLAESQRRERAAVEEIYSIAACDACKHYDPDENDCAKPMADAHKCFEWRGDVAGEGEKE